MYAHLRQSWGTRSDQLIVVAMNLTLAALGFLACLTPLKWGLGSATLLMISFNHMSFSLALYFLDFEQDRDVRALFAPLLSCILTLRPPALAFT